MKYACILALILSLSIAAVVPNMAMSTLSSKFTKLSAPAKKLNEEDVKFCGTYVSECQSSPIFSTIAEMEILGMMHKNPIYVNYPVELFGGNICSEETSMMKITMSSPLKVKNSEVRDMILTPEKFSIVFKNEAIIGAFKCTTPIELNVEYDIATLECKDEQGEDPFATYKQMIGEDMEAPMVFGENELIVKMDEDEELTLHRDSDEGCTCAVKKANQVMSFANAAPAKKLTEEDVRFCGTYVSECQSSPMLSIKAEMDILGMMHKNPIYVTYPVEIFGGATCTEEAAMMKITMTSPLKVKNGEARDMVLTPEKYTVIFKNEAVISGFKCTTPVELNVEYDVSTLECKNEQGEDPFANMKENIGKDMDAPMVFGENDLVVKDDQGVEMTLKRESDEGCTCAMKKATQAMSLAKIAPVKKVNEEDVRFCGTYTSECQSSPMLSIKADMEILGMMHRNPIYLTFPVEVFGGETCSEETSLMKMTMTSPMAVKNGEARDVVLTPEKYTVVFNMEEVISGYKCTTPIELHVEYDITTLDCKDEQGEDPFAEMKEMIGKEMESPMVFGENDLVVKDDQGVEMTLKRESDEGCTCAKGLRN